MKPTPEQLADPQWWDENVDPAYDYAFTTGPEWNASEYMVGEIEFADRYGCISNGKTASRLHLASNSWVMLAKRPANYTPKQGETVEVRCHEDAPWETATAIGCHDGKLIARPEGRWYDEFDKGNYRKPLPDRLSKLADAIKHTENLKLAPDQCERIAKAIIERGL